MLCKGYPTVLSEAHRLMYHSTLGLRVIKKKILSEILALFGSREERFRGCDRTSELSI